MNVFHFHIIFHQFLIYVIICKFTDTFCEQFSLLARGSLQLPNISFKDYILYLVDRGGLLIYCWQGATFSLGLCLISEPAENK